MNICSLHLWYFNKLNHIETLHLRFQLAVTCNLGSDDASIVVWCVEGEKTKTKVLSLLEGEGVVVLAGLAVSDQVASLFAQPEQGLCICPADRAVVPAAATIGDEREKERERAQSVMHATLMLNYSRAAPRSHSQLAFQRHGRVYALSQRGAAVLQRRHFGVNQTATGVPLQRARLSVLGRWHSRLLHAIKLDCDQRKARDEAPAPQTCCRVEM